MTKRILLIAYCDSCLFFGSGFCNKRDDALAFGKDIKPEKINSSLKLYPIPDWCPLPKEESDE